MNAIGFETLTKYTYITIHIYKLLNFADQLRLSQVSVELQSVFEKFIWKEKYRTLEVFAAPSPFPSCVVRNETGANSLCLTDEEFQEFRRVYAGKVEQFTDTSPSKASMLELRQFQNLTSLKYHKVQVTIEDLLIMAENCPNLESLHFSPCYDEFASPFGFKGHIFFDYLLKFKRLKRLVLDNTVNVIATIPYRYFRHLVTKLVKLECLILGAAIEMEEVCLGVHQNSMKLKELSVVTTFDPRKISNNLSSYLSHFEGLLILNIQLYDIVNDDMLKTIAQTCKNLENFTIRETTFKNVKTFAIPAKITVLSLIRCVGLSHDSLRQLLANTNLSKFSSTETIYEGTFEDFRISSSIQKLDVSGVNMDQFKSAYEGNENLKELTWYDERRPTGNVGLDVEGIISCSHLEVLNIRSGYVPAMPLLQLKHLQKLTISQHMPSLTWSYICAILNHPSLVEFVIDGLWMKGHEITIFGDAPIEGFSTNVSVIKIPFAIMKTALGFWLSLFCRSAQMKLTCDKFYLCKDFLRSMINHKNFPTTLRSIDVCSFTICCCDLRKRFNGYYLKLFHDTRSFSWSNWNEDTDRIILSKNT